MAKITYLGTNKIKTICQKWDSNPRPQKWTATWTQRLRPLGHPDSVHLMRPLSSVVDNVRVTGSIPVGAKLFLSRWTILGERKNFLPDRESNPGLPRDRRRSSPLDYRGLDDLLDKFFGPTYANRQLKQMQAPFFLSLKFPHAWMNKISFQTGDPAPVNIGTI